MVDIGIFGTPEDEEQRRIKELIRYNQVTKTDCPLFNCVKRGNVACAEGCQYLLDEVNNIHEML